MEKTRKCPYCGEEIMADARKCRHCGEWLDSEEDPKQEPVSENNPKEPESQPNQEIVSTSTPKTFAKQKKSKTPLIISIVIAVAILIALAIVAVFLFPRERTELTEDVAKKENEKQAPEEYNSGSVYDYEIMKRESEDVAKKEIEKQVLEAYNSGSIYDYEIMTPELREAYDAASGTRELVGMLEGEGILEGRYYYYRSRIEEQYYHGTYPIKIQRIVFDDEKQAKVYVNHLNSNNQIADSSILIMVKALLPSETEPAKWLVDDVQYNWLDKGVMRLGSEKQDMINYANSFSMDDYAGYFDSYEEESECKYEVEKVVLDAYKNDKIYDIFTPEFKRIEKEYIEVGVLCIDGDFCHLYSKIVSHRAEMLDDDKAIVYLTVDYYPSDEVLIAERAEITLVMLRNNDQWFVDDVLEGDFSDKKAMIDCIKEETIGHGGGDMEDDN